MLGVVGKELDVQMSLDKCTYLGSNLSYLEACFHQPADTPQGSGGWLTKVVRLQKLRKGVGYRQRTSYYTKFYASHG